MYSLFKYIRVHFGLSIKLVNLYLNNINYKKCIYLRIDLQTKGLFISRRVMYVTE